MTLDGSSKGRARSGSTLRLFDLNLEFGTERYDFVITSSQFILGVCCDSHRPLATSKKRPIAKKSKRNLPQDTEDVDSTRLDSQEPLSIDSEVGNLRGLVDLPFDVLIEVRRWTYTLLSTRWLTA